MLSTSKKATHLEQHQMENLTEEYRTLVNNNLNKLVFSSTSKVKNDAKAIQNYKRNFLPILQITMTKEEIEEDINFIKQNYEYLFKLRTLGGDIINVLEELYNTTQIVETINIVMVQYKLSGSLESYCYAYFCLKKDSFNQPKRYALLAKAIILKLAKLKMLTFLFGPTMGFIEEIESNVRERFAVKKMLHQNKPKHRRGQKLKDIFDKEHLDVKMIDVLRENHNYSVLLNYLEMNNIVSPLEFIKIKESLIGNEETDLTDELSKGLDSLSLEDQFLDENITQTKKALCLKIQALYRIKRTKKFVVLLQSLIRKYLDNKKKDEMVKIKEAQVRLNEEMSNQELEIPEEKKEDDSGKFINYINYEMTNLTEQMLVINNNLSYLPLSLTDIVSLIPFQSLTAKTINSFVEILNSYNLRVLYMNSCTTSILLSLKDRDEFPYYRNVLFKNVDVIVLPVNYENSNFKQIIYYFKSNNKIIYLDFYDKTYDELLVDKFKKLVQYFYNRNNIHIDITKTVVEKYNEKRVRYACDCGIATMILMDKAVCYEDVTKFNSKKLTYNALLDYRKIYYQMFKDKNKKENIFSYSYNNNTLSSFDLDIIIERAFNLTNTEYVSSIDNFMNFFKRYMISHGYFSVTNKKILQVFSIYEDIPFKNDLNKEELINVLINLKYFDFETALNILPKVDCKEKLVKLFEEIEESFHLTVASLKDLLVNEVYGDDIDYKESEMRNNLEGNVVDYISKIFTKQSNKPLIPKQLSNTYGDFRTYLDENKLNFDEILRYGIYIIDFEYFFSFKGVILPSEFTIIKLPYDPTKRCFLLPGKTVIWHFLIEYDYYFCQSAYNRHNIKETDKLFIGYGDVNLELDFKFIKYLISLFIIAVTIYLF